MSSKRDQIIDAACHLMEMQGYHATGLNQILAESEAPKGSLYYYFPDGKEGLAEEAIIHTSQAIEARIQASLTAVPDAAEAIKAFIDGLATAVEASGYQAGGPITAIALESASTNERLRQACRDAYQSWQDVFAAKLRLSGFSSDRSERLASFIIAAIEGGIILSRSRHSPQPLHDVAEEIDLLLNC